MAKGLCSFTIRKRKKTRYVLYNYVSILLDSDSSNFFSETAVAENCIKNLVFHCVCFFLKTL